MTRMIVKSYRDMTEKVESIPGREIRTLDNW